MFDNFIKEINILILISILYLQRNNLSIIEIMDELFSEVTLHVQLCK